MSVVGGGNNLVFIINVVARRSLFGGLGSALSVPNWLGSCDREWLIQMISDEIVKTFLSDLSST
jgi:hypothetical protein